MSIHTRLDLLDRPGMVAERELPEVVETDLQRLENAYALLENAYTILRTISLASVEEARANLDENVLGKINLDALRARAWEVH